MRDILTTGFAKQKARELSQRIRDGREDLYQLLDIITENEYPASAKAAYVLRTIADDDHKSVINHISFLTAQLREVTITGARRDLLKCIYDVDKEQGIPVDHQGEVMDVCFERLMDPKSATAERYYSMFILASLSKIYPEISNELVAAIEVNLPNETTNFVQNAHKIIASINARS
ncbi:MAG: hypothetical protein MK081_04210 [Flavobacteriales bacterium]|nr:hypothetical protein [Flavobacteriales bacterium]